MKRLGGGFDVDYTSICTIWQLTVTEMLSDAYGKLCTNNLEEMSAYMRRRWQHLRT